MSPTKPHRTRQLSGPAKSRYVRGLLERSGASAADASEADAEIVQVLVRRAAAEHLGRPRTSPRVTASTATADVVASPLAEVAPPPPALPAFNPYAFSAMAVLLNEGRPALEAKLAQAATREQIVQLAEAQSVRLDPALLGARKTSLKTLRAAFVEAVEKRIAHRRAVSG